MLQCLLFIQPKCCSISFCVGPYYGWRADAGKLIQRISITIDTVVLSGKVTILEIGLLITDESMPPKIFQSSVKFDNI